MQHAGAWIVDKGRPVSETIWTAFFLPAPTC